MKKVTVEDVLAATAEYFGIPEDVIATARNNQTGEVVHARYVAHYIARKMTYRSYKAIGDVLAQDHVTVMRGFSIVSKELALDKHGLFALEVEAITEKLNDQP